jgi:DNA-binding MarR family transcriptional regulator
MDQRSICLFLTMKGLSAREVHAELVAIVGLDAIAYSTVTKSVQQRQFPAIFPEPSDEPRTTIIDDAILETLHKQPFSSVRELAKLTCIPTTTVYRHLRGSLGSVLKHLR